MQYGLIRPYARRGNVGVSNLTMINAVLYVAENGCRWRALPPRFGNWHRIYTRQRGRAEAGMLDRLFAALQKHRLIRSGSNASVSTAPRSRFTWTARGLGKKGASDHRKTTRRMERIGSSGSKRMPEQP